MANKVKISKNTDNDTYLVQAISIPKGDERLFVPSPYGLETMIFNTLEEAIAHIEKYGYGYSIAKTLPAATAIDSDSIEYDKIIDVLVKNLGHENLEIRNTAINSLAKFNSEIADKLIDILKTEKNWLVQQSIMKCIEKIIDNDHNSASLFIPSLIEISNSENTFVKSAALKAIEKICELKNTPKNIKP